MIRTLGIIEKLLFIRRHPRTEWPQKIHTWTNQIAIAFVFRSTLVYSVDNMICSSLGFFGRDSEIRNRVTKLAFTCQIRPDIPISILFEGRNVFEVDNYRRSAPDVRREPWLLGNLPIESRCDFVDETYRTHQTNQRVDNIYLGALERKIVEWLAIRHPKKSNIEREKTATIVIGQPIRKGIGSDVTPYGWSSHSSESVSQRSIERIRNRLERWFRATRLTKTNDQVFFGLPVRGGVKVPETVFAMSTTHLIQ